MIQNRMASGERDHPPPARPGCCQVGLMRGCLSWCGKTYFFAVRQNVDRRADTLSGAAETAKWVITYHAKGSAPHGPRAVARVFKITERLCFCECHEAPSLR